LGRILRIFEFGCKSADDINGQGRNKGNINNRYTMLSIKSYIESGRLLSQVGELMPGFLDKDTLDQLQGPDQGYLRTAISSSFSAGTYDPVEHNEATASFKLVEKIHPETGEKMFRIEWE